MVTKFRITYTNDDVEEYDIDSFLIDGRFTILSLRRAYYNGGVHDVIKSINLAAVRSWEWVK